MRKRSLIIPFVIVELYVTGIIMYNSRGYWYWSLFGWMEFSGMGIGAVFGAIAFGYFLKWLVKWVHHAHRVWKSVD